MGFTAIGLCVVALVTAATLRPYVPFRQSLLPSAAGSYLAWASFSLLAWSSLFPVSLPFLLPLVGNWGSQFSPFLAEPVQGGSIALGIAALLLRVLARKRPLVPGTTLLAAISLNALFIGATLLLANAKASREIAASAALLHPVCVRQSSFFESLVHLGDRFHAHAIVRISDGSQYYWSYSKQAFFRGNASLNPNFPCVPAPPAP